MKPGDGCLSLGVEIRVVVSTCVRRPVRVKHSAFCVFLGLVFKCLAGGKTYTVS